jgi:hypothetical protein
MISKGTDPASPAVAHSLQEVAMPAGASAKREREYQKLEKQFKAEGRYRGREDEVAARIVNKQRSQYGETGAEKEKDRTGRSPDRNLPLEDYQSMTIAQLRPKLQGLPAAQLRKIERYEKKHKNRKGVLQMLQARLH